MRCPDGLTIRDLILLALFPCLIVMRCAGDKSVSTESDEPSSGEFTLLTYNVAGLPQGISSSNPEQNIPLISPLLNKFDVVVVQEDFFYHQELESAANHSFKSSPTAPAAEFTSGDGLNRLSVYPFQSFLRQAWEECSNASGNDCLAAKGFSVAETELAPGVVVDIYNLHMDAGGRDGDFAARASQIAQLLRMINSRSVGKAVIVAGDVNLNLTNRPRDVDMFQTLLEGAGLTDACRSLSCGRELVDRVLFRSSGLIELEALSWGTDEKFVDQDGISLSDHEAVFVRLRWVRNIN